MNKKIILSIAILSLLSLAVFVSAFYSQSNQQITIPIKKGWNIVPVTAWEIQKQDSPIKFSDFKYGYVYDVDNKKYALIIKDGKEYENRNVGPTISGDDAYGLRSSMWVYSEKEGDYNLGWGYPGFNNDFFKLSNYNLKSGWNFLFITPEMKGLRLDDFRGNCDIIKICGWQNKQKWECTESISLQRVIADQDWDIGNDLLLRVSSDCNFADQTNLPPAIPN